MSARAILAEAESLGICLKLGPAGETVSAKPKPSPELLARLKEHKAELVEILRQGHPATNPPPPAPGELPEAAPENTGAQPSVPAPAAIRLFAEQHGREVIEILLDAAINGEPDAARVAACKELLDRGFGKVPQPVEGNQAGVTIVNVVTGVRGRD